MGRAERPYSRVYWDAPDDEKFRHVWADDRALALWLRLLISADQSYPHAPYLPGGVHRASLTKLADAKLIDLVGDGRFRVHGLQAERERRSAAAREAGRASGRSRRGEGGPEGEPEGEEPPPPTAPNERSANARSANGERPLNATPTRTRTRTRGEDEREGGIHPPYPLPSDDGEPDALDAWYRLTASAPSPKVIPWIERLCREYGEGEVVTALSLEAAEDPDRSTLLGRTQNALWKRAHERSREAERARIAAAEAERRAVDEMTPEQRAANMARLGAMLREAGIAPAPGRGGEPARIGRGQDA